jgi:hypothetical protein
MQSAILATLIKLRSRTLYVRHELNKSVILATLITLRHVRYVRHGLNEVSYFGNTDNIATRTL